MPVSVKTRLGFSSVDMTWLEFLLGHGLAMLTVHGRTRAQMSKVPADWDKIGEVRKLRDKLAPNTLIIGNGDVLTHQMGQELAEEYKIDGIMIGRGVFEDPFVFSKASPWTSFTKTQKIELYKKHVDLFAKTWQNQERPVKTLNKFCKVYISDFDGAKELREELMAADNTDQLIRILTDTNR